MRPCKYFGVFGHGMAWAGLFLYSRRALHVKGVLVLCKQTACANELARYS